LNRAKIILFKLTGVLIGFAIVALIEISLRVFGYGESIPVFVPDKVNAKFSTLNPRIAKRYFYDNEVNPPLEFFKTAKPENEFRIFVVGASTVVGFPYGHSITFPKMLEHLLQKRYPNTRIKVINTGLTATNTFAILDMAGEIIDQSPDAVLIYTGHNEYYGALGVSSSRSAINNIRLKRFYLSIQKYRMVQLLTHLLPRGSTANGDGTLMAKMVRNREIKYGSGQYYDGVSQFKNNLEDIINEYSNHNIPIFIGTLVSNRKDLLPFNSSKITDPALLNLVANGDTLLIKEEYKEALESYLSVWKVDSSSANLSFKILECYTYLNDSIAIEKFGVLSSDLDMIRFRAPSVFNTIIRSIAIENDINLVDLEKSFEHYTDNIIGNELISEHVHPNIEGYKLMASEYFKSICDSGLIDLSINTKCSESNLDDYCISSLDSIYGQLLINRLMLNWPFSSSPDAFVEIDYEPKSHLGELALLRYKNDMVWAEAHNSAYSYFMKQEMYDEAFCEAKTLRAEYPTLEMPYILMVKSRIPTGEFDEVRDILSHAVNDVGSQQIEFLLIQLLILDKAVDTAIEMAYKFYQNNQSRSNNELYDLLVRLRRILDTVNQEGVIQYTPAFYEMSQIFRELGVPQAIDVYTKN
jgi:lysophospholipase L1-like esterase